MDRSTEERKEGRKADRRQADGKQTERLTD